MHSRESFKAKKHSVIAPDSLDQMKRFDPLEVLPQEIWTSIITEVASESRLRNQVIISQEVLLDLLHVSSYWEAMLSSNPVLWVDIILDDKQADTASKAAVGFHYSRMSLLSLYLYYPNEWWPAIRESILANKWRIARLYLHHSEETDINPILADLFPMENLMSIHYGGSSYFSVEKKLSYLAGSPIKWVRNITLKERNLQQLDTRQLRNLSMNENLDVVISILGEFLNLQDVELDPKRDSNTNDVIVKSRIQEQAKQLPWKTLRYRNGSTKLLESMMGQLSGLVGLDVSLTQETFKSLIPLVYLLEKLNRFEIKLKSTWRRFDRPTIHRASDSVKILSLRSSIQGVVIHQLLAQVMFQCFPYVQDLWLTTWRTSFIPIYAPNNGFLYLNILRAMDLTPGAIKHGHAQPLSRTLERFAYHGHNVLAGSFLFYSPGITHLDISTFVRSNMDVYNPAWPALQALEITCATRITWKGPAFLHLCFISLGDSAHRRVENATQLCRDVALHANYFPALQKLKLAVCPEWDILAILLDGRNVTTYPGISRITSLEILTRCPPFIIDYFRGLIKGTAVRELSYYSLSLASAYEIVQDVSIPGCAECHRALRFCNAPVKQNSKASSFKQVNYPYPNLPLEILRSWEGRADKWYSFVSALRVEKCTREFPLALISD